MKCMHGSNFPYFKVDKDRNLTITVHRDGKVRRYRYTNEEALRFVSEQGRKPVSAFCYCAHAPAHVEAGQACRTIGDMFINHG